MRLPSEQQIYSHRFITTLAEELRSQGASDTQGLLFKNSPESYCVLYRIEDRERYFESRLPKEAPEIYKIFEYLGGLCAAPAATAKDLEIAELLIQTIETSYDDRFMRNQDHPGVVYSPGDEHKLENNLAWVCGVAQANKIARLLSIPTRRSFLRRQDDGELSAFAYELGALYKVGYSPWISLQGKVYMRPPAVSKVKPNKKGIVPKVNDMLAVLDTLHTAMYPGMVRLSEMIENSFIQIIKASSVRDLRNYQKYLKIHVEKLDQLVGSAEKVGRFKVATLKEYQDIMLSVFINHLVNNDMHALKSKLVPLVKSEDASRDKLYSLTKVKNKLIRIRNQLVKEALQALKPVEAQVVEEKKGRKRKRSLSQQPRLFAASPRKKGRWIEKDISPSPVLTGQAMNLP